MLLPLIFSAVFDLGPILLLLYLFASWVVYTRKYIRWDNEGNKLNSSLRSEVSRIDTNFSEIYNINTKIEEHLTKKPKFRLLGF